MREVRERNYRQTSWTSRSRPAAARLRHPAGCGWRAVPHKNWTKTWGPVTLKTLAGRGITFEQLLAVARGQGKIVNASDGPHGPGLYYFHDLHSSLITPPKDPTCGVICSLGKAASSPEGQAAMMLIPGVGEEEVVCEQALMAEEELALAAEAGTSLVPYDADFALAQLTRSGSANASDLVDFAENQGWTRVQTPAGPIKYVDENGVTRLTIKSGSPRAPGSNFPHVEVRNAAGQRVDPYGNAVTRRSPGNHAPIVWDLP